MDTYSPDTLAFLIYLYFPPFTLRGYFIIAPILQHVHIGERILSSVRGKIPSSIRFIILEKERCPRRMCHRNSSPLGERAVVSSSFCKFSILVLTGGSMKSFIFSSFFLFFVTVVVTSEQKASVCYRIAVLAINSTATTFLRKVVQLRAEYIIGVLEMESKSIVRRYFL